MRKSSTLFRSAGDALSRLSLAWLILPAIAIDRVTKVLASRFLRGGDVAAIPGILNLTYTENTGAAFSMLSDSAWVVLVLSILLIVGLCAYLIARRDLPRLVRAGLWLVVAGGVGNVFDRLAYGYVVDFLEFAFVRFAVFNAADVFVCVGVGLTILGELRKGRVIHADR